MSFFCNNFVQNFDIVGMITFPKGLLLAALED